MPIHRPSLRTQITDTARFAEVLDSLQSHLKFGKGSSGRRTATVLDTFDWRLEAHEMTLVCEEVKRGFRLLLVHHRSGDPIAIQPAAALPRLITDLPPGPLHERLAGIVPPRALLPVATFSARTRAWPLLNEDEKTLARLVAEDRRLAGCPSSGRSAPLAPVIAVVGIRGYEKAYEKLKKALLKRHPEAETEPPLLVQAASILDRSPGTLAGDAGVNLSPTLPPGAALRAVFRSLHGIVAANTEGTRAAYDTEFLHDFRVALRRTRVLLSRSGSVFATAEVSPLQEEMRWLVCLTNPVRDLDVFIQWLDAYRAPAPPDLRRRYADILTLLEEQRVGAQNRLTRALESPRFAALMEAWQRLADETDTAGDADAGRTTLGVASAWIWKAYRRAYRVGQTVTDGTPDAGLHALRLDCKKLRYLIEPFKSLYPAEPCEQVLTRLKELQNVLGEHQDLSVQLSMLHHLGRQSRRASGIAFETNASLNRLTLFLAERKKTVRGAFRGAFDNFSRRETRRLFKQLFKKNTGPS